MLTIIQTFKTGTFSGEKKYVVMVNCVKLNTTKRQHNGTVGGGKLGKTNKENDDLKDSMT